MGKSFKDMPAFNFITSVSPSYPEEGEAQCYSAPALPEKKTKRVQLVLKPSTWEKARRAAAAQGVSVNEYVNRLIDGQ